MTGKTTHNQAPAGPFLPTPDGGPNPDLNAHSTIITAVGRCASIDELLQVLLEQAALIYPCLNWLFGEIPDTDNPVEVEILAFSPTRLQKVYLGMRIPILRSTFSQRLYEEKVVSYVGEDNGTISLLNPQFVETFALSSFMGVPLLLEGRIIGILFAATFKGEKASFPSESQLEALRFLARVGALALCRIRSGTAL